MEVLCDRSSDSLSEVCTSMIFSSWGNMYVCAVHSSDPPRVFANPTHTPHDGWDLGGGRLVSTTNRSFASYAALTLESIRTSCVATNVLRNLNRWRYRAGILLSGVLLNLLHSARMRRNLRMHVVAVVVSMDAMDFSLPLSLFVWYKSPFVWYKRRTRRFTRAHPGRPYQTKGNTSHRWSSLPCAHSA